MCSLIRASHPPHHLGNCISARLGCQQPSSASENQEHPQWHCLATLRIIKRTCWKFGGRFQAGGGCEMHPAAVRLITQASRATWEEETRNVGGPHPLCGHSCFSTLGWMSVQTSLLLTMFWRALAASGQARANLFPISQGHLLW